MTITTVKTFKKKVKSLKTISKGLVLFIIPFTFSILEYSKHLFSSADFKNISFLPYLALCMFHLHQGKNSFAEERKKKRYCTYNENFLHIANKIRYKVFSNMHICKFCNNFYTTCFFLIIPPLFCINIIIL